MDSSVPQTSHVHLDRRLAKKLARDAVHSQQRNEQYSRRFDCRYCKVRFLAYYSAIVAVDDCGPW